MTRRHLIASYLTATVLALGVAHAWVMLKDDRESPRQDVTIFRRSGVSGGPSPYQLFVDYLICHLDRRNIDVRVDSTSGSFNTLLRMERQSSSSVGIAQSDVLYHYMEGSHAQFPLRQHESHVRAVARLFPEWLHVFQSPSYPKVTVKTAETAIGGQSGSGTMVSAFNIGRLVDTQWQTRLMASEQVPNYIALPDLGESFDEWLRYRATPQLELKVESPGTSPPVSTRGEAWKPIYLTYVEALGVEHAFGRGVYRAVPDSAIRKQGYSTVRPQEATVEVDAVLVATKGTSDEVIGALIEAINRMDLLAAGTQVPDSLDVEQLKPTCPCMSSAKELLQRTAFSAIRGFKDTTPDGEAVQSAFVRPGRSQDLPVAQHPEVQLRSLSLLSRVVNDALGLAGPYYLASVLPLFATFVVVTARRGRVRRAPVSYLLTTRAGLRELVQRYWSSIVFLSALGLVGIVVAVGIWRCEYNADTLQRATPLASGGLEQSFAWVGRFLLLNSPPGELRSEYSLIWVGVLKGSYWLSGLVMAGTITRYVLRWGPKVKPKGHTIIVGWSADASRIVRELRRRSTDFRIVTFEDGSKPTDVLTRKEAEVVTVGGMRLSEALTEAGFERASAAIVVRDTAAAKAAAVVDADLWTLRLLEQVLRVRAEYWMDDSRHTVIEAGTSDAQSQPSVVVELSDVENVRTATALGADEVVCVGEFGMELMAQYASGSTGLVRVLRELLRTEEQDNELYFVPLSLAELGTGVYGDLLRRYVNATEGTPEHSLTVIGLHRHGTILLNPGHDAAVLDGDSAVVIARRRPEHLGLS